MRLTIKKPEEFDKAARVARSPGDSIVLKTDVVTEGPWRMPDSLTLADGVKLHGNGNTIRLQNPSIWNASEQLGLRRPDRDVPVLRCGAGVSLENVVLDGMEEKLRVGDPKTWIFPLGVHAMGRLGARAVTVRGVRGTRSPVEHGITNEVEAFMFLTNGNDGASHLADCVTRDCPTASDLGGEDPYITQCVIGHGADGSDVALSVVSNFEALVKGAWTGLSGNRRVAFDFCTVDGARQCAAWDTANVGEVDFDSCVFRDIAQGPALITTSPSYKGGIVWRDCAFQFGPKATHLLSVWDKTGNKQPLGPMAFTHCQFRWPEDQHPVVAIDAAGCRPIVFTRCVLPGVLSHEKIVVV